MQEASNLTRALAALPGIRYLIEGKEVRAVAVEDVALLCDGLEAAKAETQRLRVRMFGMTRTENKSHATYCTIWGDNGQGGTAEGFKEPLPAGRQE